MLTGKRIWLILIAAIAILSSGIGALYLVGWLRGGTNAFQVWNIGTPVNAIAFSPDGKLLAVGLNDGVIQLRKPSDGSLTLTLNGPASDRIALAFSPDGRILASGTTGGDAPIYLWQIDHIDSKDKAATAKRTSLGQSSISRSVAFSPDGGTLAAGVAGNKVTLWGMSDTQLVMMLKGPHVINSSSLAVDLVAFSKDGQTLAACNQIVGVSTWEMPGARELTSSFPMDRDTTSNILSAAAFSPDARTVAASYYGIGEINIWSPDNSRQGITLHSHRGDVWSLAFSPDGQMLASGGGFSHVDSVLAPFKKQDYAIVLTRVADGSVQDVLDGHQGSVRSLAWSPDGKLLASGSEIVQHLFCKLVRVYL